MTGSKGASFSASRVIRETRSSADSHARMTAGVSAIRDVSFAAPYVPMVIDALGLAGWDDHSDKETANLNWLPRLTKRAAVLIYRLGSRESAVPRS